MKALQRGAILGPAVVTGGGQGLGRAFCHALAERAPVVVVDLDEQRAGAVADEITAAGGEALGVVADVADASSVEKMVVEVNSTMGPPAVLVNNAAIFSTLRMGPFTQISPEEWRRVLDVNVTGAFLACRAVVPAMIERRYGKIINISSATIWAGRPGYLHYVTSKAALVGFTRALASEVGPAGVRVNAITPGSTRTEVLRQTISEADRELMANETALRRVQVPEDLVGTALFLASVDSDFITGQTINVDGGLTFH
jgi:3-oxoacyl-[acyl-carrier protein] reductase